MCESEALDRIARIIAKQMRRAAYQVTSTCTLKGCEGPYAECLRDADKRGDWESYAAAAIADFRAEGLVSEKENDDAGTN